MGGFINFNGTAGVWRKSTILDAGDWESDTLTEDLDLSYRAQMKNWKFIYLEDVISPAELPPVMSALKSQQYRWTKGGAEVARKHFGNVMRSAFSFNKRWHGMMHLLNSVVFLCIIVSAIMSIPLLFAKHRIAIINDLFLWASFFLLSFVIIGAVYYVSSRAWFKKRSKSLLSFIITFPLFLSVSMGLSLHNAVAVIEGLVGRKTPFIRTPKFNIQSNSDNWIDNSYIRQSLSPMILAEGILSIYFMYGIVTGIRLHDYGLLPFHFMLAFGFGTVFYFSVFQRKSQD
jgi:cellulose synthase/poly-beta-1,6-N-acetylglucosamine synthase-like glycosyltransferase